MPIYTYECRVCKIQTDMFYDMNNKALAIECPRCPTFQLTMLPVINFKQSGQFLIDRGRHYSTALGKVVKNDRELRAEAKDRGWEPVDNASAKELQKWKKEETASREKRILNSYYE